MSPLTDPSQADDLLPPAGFLRLGRIRNLQKSKQGGGKKENNMNPLIQLKRISQLFLVPFLLACFGGLNGAQAIITDTQDWFQFGNTAAGQTALLNLRGGHYNTAI